ncbi:thioesterase II family protein [Streptomyces sp. AK02-01A]|uniref:thioesterase II family protein n=1 Tax=Streptomyces sp. AK02-01A TaxID=3028648 RepID=UPI0029BB4821|nr:alpha/beta fold hydrolase [Streptomyces sp. AK02-01A]MDX3854333.1 alpha/beta fold hydrolase [Streptomyces sp. AK02-01A]
MTRVPRQDWIRRFAPRPRARLRLVCFAHAGGAASAFHGWAELLPEWIELVTVQYPGRQDRYGEPIPAGIPELAEEILRGAEDIAGFDRPTAFFGHSMGALVAFEVARRLQWRSSSPPAALFVSACKAPAARTPRGLTFEENEIRDYLGYLGGSGAALLENEELWEFAFPVICGDLRMTEAYRYAPGAPLTCPVVSIAGDRDPAVTPDDAALWKDYTTGEADARVLRGGHFYFEESLPGLIAILTERLTRLVRH